MIALAADFRIAVPHATLAFLFTKVGLAGADMGAAYLLPRVVGLARATQLLFLGDPVNAEEALRIGLVNEVVEPPQLLERARALGERLASGPAFALGITKKLLNHELDIDFTAAIEAEAQAQALCMQAPEFRAATLPKLKANVAAGEADPGVYALVYDRTQRDQGKNQLFGQQLECTKANVIDVAPLDDAATVNVRRAELGLIRLELYTRVIRQNSPPCGAFSHGK